MMILGIDPGLSGAIAALDTDRMALTVHDVPTAPNKKGKPELALSVLAGVFQNYPGAVCWIERVGAMPGQGVSSMFRFGQTTGALQMGAAYAGCAIHYVTPTTWKKHFGIAAVKGAARGLAMERFPAQANLFKRVKDDGRAEAALIALYGAEKAEGR